MLVTLLAWESGSEGSATRWVQSSSEFDQTCPFRGQLARNVTITLQIGFALGDFLFACYLAKQSDECRQARIEGSKTEPIQPVQVGRPRLGQVPSVLISQVSQEIANTKTISVTGHTKAQSL